MKKISIQSITGTIHCVSSQRVGGGDELLEIGAAELTCVKHPVTLEPYIPGSSFKGRLRAEMENKLDRAGYWYNPKHSQVERPNKCDPCGCALKTCLVCRIFGPFKNTRHELGPSRLLVRDAQPLPNQTIILEIKAETINNRLTGTGGQPRKMERVPAGTQFGLKLNLQVWDIDDAECAYNGKKGVDAMVEFLKDALRLVQATGIGSGISRGSGEIEFRDLKLNGNSFTL